MVLIRENMVLHERYMAERPAITEAISKFMDNPFILFQLSSSPNLNYDLINNIYRFIYNFNKLYDDTMNYIDRLLRHYLATKKARCDEIYKVYKELHSIIFEKKEEKYLELKLRYITELPDTRTHDMKTVDVTFKRYALENGIKDPHQLLRQCDMNPDIYNEMILLRQKKAEQTITSSPRNINLLIILNNLDYQNKGKLLIMEQIDRIYNEQFNPGKNPRQNHVNAFHFFDIWYTEILLDKRIGSRTDIDILSSHLVGNHDFRRYSKEQVKQLLERNSSNYYVVRDILIKMNLADTFILEFKLIQGYHDRIVTLLLNNSEDAVRRKLTEEKTLQTTNNINNEQMLNLVTRFPNDILSVNLKDHISKQNTLLTHGVPTREAADQLLHESNGNLENAIRKKEQDFRTPRLSSSFSQFEQDAARKKEQLRRQMEGLPPLDQ